MKKFLALFLIALMSVSLFACNGANGTSSGDKSGKSGTSGTPTVTKHTVIFEVDGDRYKTLKVADGETITATVDSPVKDGYSFSGWALDGEIITLSEYVVNKDVTFTAKFTRNDVDTSLNVNDVKVEGKEYYLVIGWWECTKINDDGTQKFTSYLTEDQVRLFYANVILYLKAKGATEADLANVSVRNYSSEDVESMGAGVLADGDVAIMIGVGNNVNSKAGLSLYEADNANSKFQTKMGTTPTDRYVALLDTTNALGVNVYDWLKTETGKQSFVKQLTASEISVVPERSDEINLTVTVHGDTDAVTVLTDADTAVTMPEITVAEDKIFKGFALSADGAVALNVSKDAELKYANLRSLVNVGDTAIELYPVIEDKPVKEDREHFVVVAWYDKETTSGLNQTIIEAVEAALKAYLLSEGVAQTDVDTVLFRAYSGNVGPSTTEIVTDNDVDIMLGWGSAENITTTGTIPAASITETISDYTMGAKTNRYLHVICADETVEKAMGFFRTADLDGFKAPVPEVFTEITVTVHGDTDAVTVLTDADTVISMPEITVAEGYEFKGFALSADGEVALKAAKDAALKYDDVKTLIAESATTLELYPVVSEIVVETVTWGVVGVIGGADKWEDDIALVRQDDGTYKSEAITFIANDEFKVRQNGKWDVSYPEGTDNWIITETYIGNFYVVFNAETGEIVLEAVPVSKMNVYVQIQGTNLTEDEANALKERFLATLTEDEQAKVVFNNEVVSSGADFTAIIEAAEDVDVVIGGNNPINGYGKHEDGPTANAGAGHFASTNRKIIISDRCNDLDLAKKLYAFVTADYTVEVTFTVNDEAMGSIDKTSGTFVCGAAYSIDGAAITSGEFTVTATANAGYEFAGWFIGESKLPDSGAIGGTATIVATFQAESGAPAEVTWGVVGVIGGADKWEDDIALVKQDDGTYKSEAITFIANDEFKVRQNGKWDVSYPEGLNNWIITETYIGNFYVVFNAETGDIALEAVAESKLNVYIQVQGTNLTEVEANTLKERFLATLTEDEQAKVVFHNEVVSSGADFTAIIEAAEDVDVVIGGNNPVNNYGKHEDGPTANAGTGHFASTNRKIIISDRCNDLDLAKKLYAFVTADYTE